MSKSGCETHILLAGLVAVTAILCGCDSSKSGGSGGVGGHAGTVASQTNEGGSLGSGTSSASAGTTGLSAGGTGSTGLGGKTGSTVGGASTGSDSKGGAGGTGLGGTGQTSGPAGSGGTGAGGSGWGGATTLDAGAVDAGCVGTACAQDAGSNLDVPPACLSIRTEGECDQRSDCHSVYTDDMSTCGCAKAGCCIRFVRCEDGGSVTCAGKVTCMQTTPTCEAPFAVQYRDGCFNGCILAKKCSPTDTCPSAAPANGSNCGSNALSCVYQDCAGAGRTQALCQGGTWKVQTATCDSLACKGGGVYSGGGVICGPGQICVQTTGSGGAYVITPSCATNNCGSSPLALSCVQGLSGNCTVTSESGISCSTPVNCTGSGGCPP